MPLLACQVLVSMSSQRRIAFRVDITKLMARRIFAVNCFGTINRINGVLLVIQCTGMRCGKSNVCTLPPTATLLSHSIALPSPTAWYFHSRNRIGTYINRHFHRCRKSKANTTTTPQRPVYFDHWTIVSSITTFTIPHIQLVKSLWGDHC